MWPKQTGRQKKHQSKAVSQDLRWFSKYVFKCVFFDMRDYCLQYIYGKLCVKSTGWGISRYEFWFQMSCV